MHHQCAPGETILYADVCSLYPWACKYGKYPVGHPNVITENFADVRTYEGLIKVGIL